MTRGGGTAINTLSIGVVDGIIWCYSVAILAGVRSALGRAFARCAGCLQNVSPVAALVLSGHAVHQYPAVLAYSTVSVTVPRKYFQGVKHLFVLNLEHFEDN